MKHTRKETSLTEKNYGVYFEYVTPRTVFFETKGLSEAEARLIVEKNFGDTPGLKILHIFELTNLPTYKPKEPSKLILPNNKQEQ
jgi:hypothetical protein